MIDNDVTLVDLVKTNDPRLIGYSIVLMISCERVV